MFNKNITISRVLMTLLFAGFLFSCNGASQPLQQETETNNEGNVQQEVAYQALFAELDDLVSKSADAPSLTTRYGTQPTDLRGLNKKKTTLRKIWDGVVIVASDALGGFVGGAVGSAGGAIIVGSAASAIAAKELGYDVRPDTTSGNPGFSIVFSSQLTLKDGSKETIGEGHNNLLTKMKLDGSFSTKHSDDEMFQRVKTIVTRRYNLKESELLEKNPLNFKVRDLIGVIDRPNVNTYEDLVHEIASITHLPSDQVNFILTSCINNYQLTLEDKDLKQLNIDISKIVKESSLPSADKQLLIDATSISANSALYWKRTTNN
ncbi:MAG: hypothetical protein JNG44_06950 [Porphyromonas sp.]|uniref:hypothetical protein n=1 Tax=Porphyromonas sp. TaxID=1924944 RepID=UPI001A5D7D87|nr:hypothetical protein [Porphyromonas sp.]MBL6453405.1 hypothetical protein [Porphyromonas sp.]